MSIRIESLSKTYGSQKALNGVTLDIPKGQIVGLLGPNGAGKTTLMKILTGYIPQNEGSAQVCDLDTSKESLAIRRKVGYLPEHNPLYLDMYVTEFLQFVARLHQLQGGEVERVIERVGLTPERHKKLGELSKGFRQRAGLAAALIHDPEVLILDEPTTGLDPNQLVPIRELIKEVGQDRTVLLSTHIMQEVEAVCDRVVFIRQGQLVREGMVADILKEGSMEDAFRKATAS